MACALERSTRPRAAGRLQRNQEVWNTMSASVEEASLLRDIAYIVVRPRWIRFSDYDQKPLIIEEIAKSG
jgi:hypothetical protein